VGEEFVALARREHPDLMILDVELPGEQRGWQAAQTLRGELDGAAAPVIACSWLPRADAVALMSSCAAYLQKPELHYDDFVAALKEAGFEPAQR
jgi:CheY-like chemotaxis protein